MAYNGSGVYSPPAASFPAVTGTVIDSAKYNAVVNDIATALTGVITKDGQTTVTANLPMATYRHTGVSDGTALTDYSTVNQVVDNALAYGGASAAGTDTYAVSLPISPGAYVAGNRYQFLADVANTGACTINFNGLGAKSIKMVDGNDPFTNAIQIGAADVIYDGTNFVLLNPFFDFLSVTGQVTATHTELNILDGVTSTTAELNILDGVTSTAAELNILDGATLDVTELNYVDGVTSSIQTQIDAIKPANQEIMSITGTVAASALTCGLGADFLYFRNATLTNGSASKVTFSALSLVVPSGATLGTVDAVQSRLVLVAINNAGTAELAIVNQAGGDDLSETGVISTTAIGTGSDSDNVFYSTSARTDVAYRVVGVIESTQATAGTWDTSPALLQGAGSNALTAMSSIGYGQTWQSVTRSSGTTYYNTTGRPITLKMYAQRAASVSGSISVTVNGVAVTIASCSNGVSASSATGSIIIPPNAAYTPTISNLTTSNSAWELR